MLDQEFNLDEYGAVQYEDGKEEGLMEAAITMLKEGLTPEVVSRCTKMPIERVYQLQPQ